MNILKFIFINILFSGLIFGQSFTFQPDTTNFYGQPGAQFDNFTDIHNISGQDLFLKVIRTKNNLPNSSWTSALCIGDLCFPPDADTIDAPKWFGPLPPDSVLDFHLLVTTDPVTPGTGAVKIKVENKNDPSDTISVEFGFSTQTTFLSEVGFPVSGTFQLYQNYPNPFNPETNIAYEIGGFQSRKINLTVYNIIGEKVKILVNEVLSPGVYQVAWDGKDGHNNQVSSGLYFYELVAGNYRMIGRMIFIK
jgi:hypothetical protein